MTIQSRNPRLDAPFSPAPEALIEASTGKSGRGRLLIFLRIWKHAGPSDLAEVSMPTLARECGLKLETVQRDVAWLVQTGWIMRLDFRGGRPSRYRVRCLQGRPSRPSSSGGPTRSVTPTRRAAPPKAFPPSGETVVATPAETAVNAQSATLVAPELAAQEAISASVLPAEQALPVVPAGPKASKRSADRIPLPPDAPSLSEEEHMLLEAWWQRRCQKHRRADRLALGRRNLHAIDMAREAGVLADYLEKAREAAWMSLDHAGLRRIIDYLSDAAKCSGGDDSISSLAVVHSRSRMLGSGKPKFGHSDRRQDYVDAALRLITSVDDNNGQDIP